MAITAERVKQIHQEMAEALDAIAAKHGLKRAPSKVVYANDHFKFSCHFGDVEEIGDVDPKYLRTMDRNGWQYGFTRADVGKIISINSVQFEFVGMVGTAKAVLRRKIGGGLVTYPAEVIRDKLKTD
jgi:hypothetical protein